MTTSPIEREIELMELERRGGYPLGPEFTSWLLTRTQERNPVGDLARDVAQDPTWPYLAQSLLELHHYLAKVHAVNGAHKALATAYWRWRGRGRRRG